MGWALHWETARQWNKVHRESERISFKQVSTRWKTRQKSPSRVSCSRIEKDERGRWGKKIHLKWMAEEEPGSKLLLEAFYYERKKSRNLKRSRAGCKRRRRRRRRRRRKSHRRRKRLPWTLRNKDKGCSRCYFRNLLFSHSISYDGYNICDHVSHNPLGKFKVTLLREMWAFYEISFKARDLVAFKKAIFTQETKWHGDRMHMFPGNLRWLLLTLCFVPFHDIRY